jgi:hypothetical protein
MAASSSSSSGLASMITHPVSEKLAKHNHATWKAQVMATMCGACLEGYLNGKTPKPVTELDTKDGDKITKVVNPAYEDWRVVNQHVLIFLVTSVSKDVLVQIATKQMTAEAWQAIETMF